MATATLLRAGDVVGGFRIDDVIGIGGMAIVYRAEQVSLGRPVALKVLSSKLTSDPIFRERFRREGTHAATLEHPNIVPVYDSGEQDGLLYLAMRLVEGTNLAELVQTRGVTADQTIETLRPIASALDTAHAAGLIHRDIKPQNILITPQGHPYLADFGVAKGSNTYGLTATGGFVGSVNYASPEQIKGLTLTPASDVYALTAVLYQCLTGHVPYPRETDAGIMHAHLHEPPPTLPTISGANSDFHTVLARGMAKDAGARYGHAGDLMNAAALSVGRLPSRMRKRVPAFPDPTRGDVPSAPMDVLLAHAEGDVVELPSAAAFTSADRKRPPAPKPESPPRPRRWPLLAGAGAAALAAGVAIALLAGGSGKASAASFRSGRLLLSSMSGWHRSQPTIEGLRLTAPIAIATPGARVLAGEFAAPAKIAGALPASVLAAYGSPTQKAVITLPLGPAKRYSWTGSSRRPPMWVLVVATEAGEIAIACGSATVSAAQSIPSGCAGVADKARIVGAQVEYPGPDPRVAGQLTRTLAPRARLVAAPPADLRARRLPSRASALEQAVAVDTTAAASLKRMNVANRYGVPVATLADALAREGGVLGELAAAARAGNRSQYVSLRGRLDNAGVSVTAAAHGVTTLGFAFGHLKPINVPPPPARRSRHAAQPIAPAAPAQGPGSLGGGRGASTPAPANVAPSAPAPAVAPAPQPSTPAPERHHPASSQSVVSAPS
jgi:serine/threonine protein kinase